MAVSYIDMQQNAMNYLKDALVIGDDQIARLWRDKDGNISGKIDNHRFSVGQYDFGPRNSLSLSDLKQVLDYVKTELGTLSLTGDKPYDTEIRCIDIEIGKLDQRMDEIKPIEFGPVDKAESYTVREFGEIFRANTPDNISLRINNVFGEKNDKIFSVNYHSENRERFTIADVRVRVEDGMSMDGIKKIFESIRDQIPDRVDNLERQGLLNQSSKNEIISFKDEIEDPNFETRMQDYIDNPDDTGFSRKVRSFDPCTSIDPKGKIELKDEIKNGLSDEQYKRAINNLTNIANTMLKFEKTLQKYERMPYSELRSNTHYFMTLSIYQDLAKEYSDFGGKVGKGFAVTDVPSFVNRMACFFRIFNTNILTSIYYKDVPLTDNEKFAVDSESRSLKVPETAKDVVHTMKAHLDQLKSEADTPESREQLNQGEDKIEKFEKDIENEIKENIKEYKEEIDNIKQEIKDTDRLNDSDKKSFIERFEELEDKINNYEKGEDLEPDRLDDIKKEMYALEMEYINFDVDNNNDHVDNEEQENDRTDNSEDNSDNVDQKDESDSQDQNDKTENDESGFVQDDDSIEKADGDKTEEDDSDVKQEDLADEKSEDKIENDESESEKEEDPVENSDEDKIEDDEAKEEDIIEENEDDVDKELEEDDIEENKDDIENEPDKDEDHVEGNEEDTEKVEENSIENDDDDKNDLDIEEKDDFDQDRNDEVENEGVEEAERDSEISESELEREAAMADNIIENNADSELLNEDDQNPDLEHDNNQELLDDDHSSETEENAFENAEMDSEEGLFDRDELTRTEDSTETDSEDAKEDAILSEVKNRNLDPDNGKTAENTLSDFKDYISLNGDVDRNELIENILDNHDSIDVDKLSDAVVDKIESITDNDDVFDTVEAVKAIADGTGLDFLEIMTNVFDTLMEIDPDHVYADQINQAIIELSDPLDLESTYPIDGIEIDLTDSVPVDPITGDSLSDVSQGIEIDQGITADQAVMQDVEQLGNDMDQVFQDAKDYMESQGVDDEKSREFMTEASPDLINGANDITNDTYNDLEYGTDPYETATDIPDDNSWVHDVVNDAMENVNNQTEAEPADNVDIDPDDYNKVDHSNDYIDQSEIAEDPNISVDMPLEDNGPDMNSNNYDIDVDNVDTSNYNYDDFSPDDIEAALAFL